MIFHHILLDLFSDFGKGPKRGLKKTIFVPIPYSPIYSSPIMRIPPKNIFTFLMPNQHQHQTVVCNEVLYAVQYRV